ncbi:phytoene desaturase family protein [Lihuaxuella thermophila]|uniref:4,4'-diaponeurosporene oxygenase n=1 Tax=Lihuaxuella thermophila TaxID=1173111 RepID=A0A1H8CYB8_9BACL|nr:phytoene desaturase family protein [Lihuaxuella thermophila]SEM99879.1 phytoene desaturase [Lihuaxuella thermophila]
MKKGVIIGGGMAGLVSAIKLAARGYEMILLEKQKKLGGKLQEVTLKDYRFDLGPSMISMPWIFEQVFREAGKTIDPDLRLIPLAVNSRNFFSNKTVIDLTADPDEMSKQLARFSPENRQGFLDYLVEIQRMYEVVEEHFWQNPMGDWSDFFSPRMLKAFMSVHPFRSMDSFHRRFFDDPRLLAMMNRYAAYVGSSPFHTPATVSLIAYLELVQGVFYIEGGNYRLIEAYEKLARSLGVQIYTECPVDEILVQEEQVVGVRSGDEKWEADFVISDVDVRTTKERMLLEKSKPVFSASFRQSAFLCLFGVSKVFPHLHHHNFFFPLDYGREYIDIFERREWPLSPSIYICNSSFSERDHAKRGSNLYVLVHVPASHGYKEEELATRMEEYRHHLIYWLENDCGLSGLSDCLEVEKIYGPKELEEGSGTWGGPLYGSAVHRIKSFLCLPVKDRRIKGLYYTGSTTRPVGGAPMAVISGFHTAKMVERDCEQE